MKCCFQVENERCDIMTIYEANSKLIKIGNAMIEEYGLKYYIVPRTTSEEINMKQYKQPYDDVESAYVSALRLSPNWNM